MNPRRLLGHIRWSLISAAARRPIHLPASPSVSFTFDDFPRSALDIAGEILLAHQAAGTYYTAIGLAGTVNEQGEHFALEDLPKLVAQGHELASHTYGHVSGRNLSGPAFLENALAGRTQLEQACGQIPCPNFSYPFGHATVALKKRLASHFSSCRGIVPGVNHSPADANLLRSNSLYSHVFDEARIEAVLDKAATSGGWVIFYTHDVRDKPSPFGCTPGQFERVVRLTKNRNIPIRTVAQVMASAPS